MIDDGFIRQASSEAKHHGSENRYRSQQHRQEVDALRNLFLSAQRSSNNIPVQYWTETKISKMVNFGQKLLQARHMPWALEYLDYDQLKQLLDREFQDNALSSRQSAASGNSPDFISLLYIQTEKVSFFVIQELGRITADLTNCRQDLLRCVTVPDPAELVSLEDKYIEAGEKILRLIRFIEINVTGFRKILKKHDKISRAHLSLSYLSLNGNSAMGSGGLRFRRMIGEKINLVEMGNQLMQPLLQDDTITAVTLAYEAGIEELRRLWLQYQSKQAPDAFVKLDINSRSNTLPNLQLMDINGTADTTTNRSHCDLQTVQSEELASRKNSSPGQMLLQIHAARGRLHHTNAFVKMLATTMMPIREEDDLLTNEGDRHRPSRFSNTLNLLSTFLYMSKSLLAAVLHLEIVRAQRKTKSVSSVEYRSISYHCCGTLPSQQTIILWRRRLAPTPAKLVPIAPSHPSLLA